MNPTPEQLQQLYEITYQLTAQLQCYIKLVELLPNRDLCIVVQPRTFTNQWIIIYIKPNGDKQYV
ncbi:MAG: hypothetical protein AB4041_16315 [Microcystaceae cyanobacterium]